MSNFDYRIHVNNKEGSAVYLINMNPIENGNDSSGSKTHIAENNDSSVIAATSSAAAHSRLAAAIESDEEPKRKHSSIEADEADEHPKRKRSCWVKDFRFSKEELGNTQELMLEPKLDSVDFKKHLKMDESCFNFILSAIGADIEKQDSNMRKAVSPKEKLAVTLRFLATGESYQELDYNSKLSKSFLSVAIIDVCEAIYKNLKNKFLKFPTTTNEWTNIADDYNLRWQFPNCLGALAAKHIAFRPLKTNADLFYNSKGFHSIVLLGLADAYGKFIFVDIGRNGRISDEGVLQRSNFMFVLEHADKLFPPKKRIGNGRLIPHVIVADNAFPLTDNMMTAYPLTTTDEIEKTYNRRLSRARQNIDRAFRILTNRFQIFQKTINLREDKVKPIVQCCCVLHNFLMSRSTGYSTENESIANGMSDNENSSSSEQINAKSGEAVRQALAEYFNASQI